MGLLGFIGLVFRSPSQLQQPQKVDIWSQANNANTKNQQNKLYLLAN